MLIVGVLGVDKKRNPGFSFLCQTMVSASFTDVRKLTFLGSSSGPLYLVGGLVLAYRTLLGV